VADAIAGTTAAMLLALFFEVLTMFFLFRRQGLVTSIALEMLPLRPEYTRKLFDEFKRVGRTTLMSTVINGLAQGVLATIGYAMTGIPRPLFFGVATAVTSLVPGLGTMLVWVPAGVVLLLTGHSVGGIVLLAWGVVVVTVVPNYVVLPRLVGRGSELPALATFTALFGGASAFGVKGLIIGPVIMAVAFAVLRIYADETRALRKGML
jgi:predicted PurR-regulated permease PerM